jgi:hypothetical protein
MNLPPWGREYVPVLNDVSMMNFVCHMVRRRRRGRTYQHHHHHHHHHYYHPHVSIDDVRKKYPPPSPVIMLGVVSYLE